MPDLKNIFCKNNHNINNKQFHSTLKYFNIPHSTLVIKFIIAILKKYIYDS